MTSVQRALPFAIAGSLAFFIDAGVLVLTAPLIGAFWGRVLSFAAGVSTTWLINRTITFRDRTADVTLGQEFARYLLAMLPGAATNWIAYGIVASVFGSSPIALTLAVAAGSLAGMVVNFIAADRLVFKKPR